MSQNINLKKINKDLGGRGGILETITAVIAKRSVLFLFGCIFPVTFVLLSYWSLLSYSLLKKKKCRQAANANMYPTLLQLEETFANIYASPA